MDNGNHRKENKNCYEFNVYAFIDAMKVQFEAIQMADERYKDAKTPAILETLIRKQYPIKAGDFIFLEWEKFTEDILVTSDRSALISSQTSKITIVALAGR